MKEKKKKDEEIQKEAWLDKPEKDSQEAKEVVITIDESEEDARKEDHRNVIVSTTRPQLPIKKGTFISTHQLDSKGKLKSGYHGIKGEEKND